MAIENVKFIENYDSNVNEKRIISTLLHEDIQDFPCERFRFCKVLSASVLGNHWRDFPEVYGIIGRASFTLEDIDTKERVMNLKQETDCLFPQE